MTIVMGPVARGILGPGRASCRTDRDPESLGNVAAANIWFGRREGVPTRRKELQIRTLVARWERYQVKLRPSSNRVDSQSCQTCLDPPLRARLAVTI
jgi:hypothetical protein